MLGAALLTVLIPGVTAGMGAAAPGVWAPAAQLGWGAIFCWEYLMTAMLCLVIYGSAVAKVGSRFSLCKHPLISFDRAPRLKNARASRLLYPTPRPEPPSLPLAHPTPPPNTRRQPGAGALAPVGIGLTVMASALACGSLTGSLLNPARALGPALVFRNVDAGTVVLYLTAQLSGAALGAVLSRLLQGGGGGAKAATTATA